MFSRLTVVTVSVFTLNTYTRNILIRDIGTKLLDHILSQAQSQTRATPTQPVKSLYLHVQTTNQEAVDWYTKRGFEIEQTVEGYYRNIEDRDAYILVRKLE